MNLKLKIEEEFQGKGNILKKLPGFKPRKEQLSMAIEVLETLDKGKILLAEAGTGVGKSFAYLLPIILWVKKKNLKAVVATYTKVLQYQLYNKDLPFLKSAMDDGFSYELFMGQENFICKRRLYMNLTGGLFDSPKDGKKIEKISKWLPQSTGIFEDYPEEIKASIKDRIARRSSTCMFKNCSYYSECPYYRKKEALTKAEIIVINHHLFFANLLYGEKILPEFDIIVFDEAQHLEDVAANFFGYSLSNRGLIQELHKIYNPNKNRGFLISLPYFSKISSLVKKITQKIEDYSFSFFNNLREMVEEDPGKKRIETTPLYWNGLVDALKRFSEYLYELKREEEDEEKALELSSYAIRLDELSQKVEDFALQESEEKVYWIERNNDKISINSALIDVSGMLSEKVFIKPKKFILTSATLSIQGNFSFLKERLGIKDSREIVVSSPFDYTRRTILYIDKELPLPDEPGYQEKIAKRINSLLRISKGRALVLFTSYKTLNEVFSKIGRDYPLLQQKETGRGKILEDFKTNESSVLFATKSFWEGIDVPGKSLVLLIITRLPFDVPDSPRLQAISELLKSQGKDPFWEFQLPLSLLRFRQGVGRLMRKEDDYGIIAVLDSRIAKKAYGRLFRDVLFSSPIVDNLRDVKLFIQEIENSH